MTTNDEDWVPTEEDVRHYSRTWFTESDMDRFLARVRRDAAREALDGLAEQYEHDAYIRAYRDAHYPETEN